MAVYSCDTLGANKLIVQVQVTNQTVASWQSSASIGQQQAESWVQMKYDDHTY